VGTVVDILLLTGTEHDIHLGVILPPRSLIATYLRRRTIAAQGLTLV